jgi:hypothetical protein
MRLLIIVLTLVLVVSLLGLALENLGTRADVTMWQTTYRDVPLYLITVLAVVAGIVYAGVIAVAEGAHIRLANRRLAREVRKLETEINFLRTEPPSASRREPDELPGPTQPVRSRGSEAPGGKAPASAPVYSREGEDWPAETGDEDDPTYSGGHAV